MSHWPSEFRTFKDEQTGRTITQLTTTGNNVHLYFTENSFDCNRNEIIFLSDRESGEDRAPHEDPKYSLFRMNLDTGEMERLSDDVLDGAGSATKTPDTSLIAYRTADDSVRLLDTQSGKLTTLYERDPRFEIASVPSIASNRPQRDHERLHPLPGRELRRVQRALLQDQGWAHHRGIYGWLRLARYLSGHAPAWALPVLAGRPDARHVLP